MYLICDRIETKESTMIPFPFQGCRRQAGLEILVSKGKVAIAGVGEYDGHVTKILGDAQHCCGLQGFNPMLGDTCDGCEQSALHRGIMDAAKSYLRERGVLTEYKI